MRTAFDYVDRNTFVHRLHPGTKMAFVVLTLAVVMIPYSPRLLHLSTLVLWLAFAAALWIAARISPRQFYSLFKVLLATFVFLILVQGLMYRGEHPLLRFADLPIPGGANLGVITREGAFFGFLLCVRVLVAVTALPLFVTTTPSSKIMSVLSSFRVSPRFTFMFVSALTFTSLIFQIWQSIIEAQKLRAFDIDSMSVWQKARRAYVPVVVPMILLLFRKGNDLQIALESKGFGAPTRRTEMEECRMGAADYLFLAVMIAVFGLALWLRFK